MENFKIRWRISKFHAAHETKTLSIGQLSLTNFERMLEDPVIYDIANL